MTAAVKGATAKASAAKHESAEQRTTFKDAGRELLNMSSSAGISDDWITTAVEPSAKRAAGGELGGERPKAKARAKQANTGKPARKIRRTCTQVGSNAS